jgi:hypothetical protein
MAHPHQSLCSLLYTGAARPGGVTEAQPPSEGAPRVCCAEFRRRWPQRGVHKPLVISRRPTLIASIQLRQGQKESRRAVSNRLHLLQLRVCGQWLLSVAQPYKSRISRLVSFLRLALCCTVLRSWWCQSGVNITSMLRCRGSLSNTPLEYLARGVTIDTPSGVFTVRHLCFHSLFPNLRANR